MTRWPDDSIQQEFTMQVTLRIKRFNPEKDKECLVG